MHKLFGPDPRSLRPADREEQNTRFKVWRNWNERRRSSTTVVEKDQPVTGLKVETTTPAPFSQIESFDDADTLASPLKDIHTRFDATSPTGTFASSPGAPIYSAFPKDDDLDVFTFSQRPLRMDTDRTASSQMSSNSVLSLKNRLGVSTFFAKQIGLIMRFTAGSNENLTTLTAHRTPSDFPMVRRSHALPVPHPGLAVPGDFMVAPKYVQSCQRERHFAQYLEGSRCACWCVITDETTDSDRADNFYVTAKGDICDRAVFGMNNLTSATGVDIFGNTLAHLFAALETQQGIDMTLHLVRSGGANSLVANKADQTFIHVLSSVWFTGLNDPNAPLYQLLNELLEKGVPAAVLHRDVYGRTFFHQLDRYCSDVHAFNNIMRNYPGAMIPRDAFGVQPPSHLAEHSHPGPRRMGTIPLSPLSEEIIDQDDTTLHMSLITVVRACYENPAIEDDHGRNGLQCLAVLKLGIGAPPPSNPSSPNPNQPSGPNKRKRGKEDAMKTIETRAQYLENLLTPMPNIPSPDVNHYDKKGMTVLMTFATHLSDEHDKSGLVIDKIIDTLLAAGAKLDARNRQGETALLVAARHGNKHVVSKLLDRGANLHARDKSGRGIMAIINSQVEESPRDLPLYGRLQAVQAAVVAKKLGENGGQDEPSFLDEWCWPALNHV